MKTIVLGVLLLVAACAGAAVGQTEANSQAKLRSSAEAVVDMLVEGKFDVVAALVNSEFTGSLSADKLRDGWQSLVANLGSFRRRTGSLVGRGPGGYDEVTITCEFEKASLPARILFDGEMKIVGLLLRPQNSTTAPPPLPPGSQVDSKAVAAKAMADETIGIILREDFSGLRKKFNDQMESGLSEQRIREIWSSVLQNVGPFRKQVSSQYASIDQLDVVAVRCEFDRGFVQIRVAFDQQKRIAGLYFFPIQ